MASQNGAPPDRQTEPAILIDDLQYAVPGKRILHDIHLKVEGGSILAVMGMSGCGKTSLLKCIAGLVKPTGGHVFIEGQDIVPLSESELDRVRLRIGLVFQYAALFDSLTVFENVSFGLRHHRKLSRKEMARIVAERLEDVGMSDTENLYPSQLSGGMQKRVGLARSLAMEPAVLLYDEPTSGLDPVIARNIDDLILETRDKMGKTSVVVSHDIASIFRIADRIAMLDAGTVIAYGTPEDMRQSDHPKVKEFVQGAE
jgi:phospholipid/cholesterol/gamma-HCH transport system ATP-binding protein